MSQRIGMKASPSKPSTVRRRAGRSGNRHWFRITGLPGWKLAQCGEECPPALPATLVEERKHQSDPFRTHG
jgi:hypothetical protein